MDKQTLSNYGWLVIVTLILAVMLALATPFGTYVGDAVVSVANGFVGTANSAADEDNIATNQSKWEDKLILGNYPTAGALYMDGNFKTYDNLNLDSSDMSWDYNVIKFTWPLDKITIPNNFFEYCQHLHTIIIPNTVKEIGYGAFDSCYRLSYIDFRGTVEQWNNISKGAIWNFGVPALKVKCYDGSVELHKNEAGAIFSGYITDINCHKYGYQHIDSCFTKQEMFISWDDLYADGYGYYDENVFGYNNKAISKDSIGMDAFADCLLLESIIIPAKVSGSDALSDYAFDNCKNLKNITYLGTMAQFEEMDNCAWYSNIPAKVVHCSDGDYKLS